MLSDSGLWDLWLVHSLLNRSRLNHANWQCVQPWASIDARRVLIDARFWWSHCILFCRVSIHARGSSIDALFQCWFYTQILRIFLSSSSKNFMIVISLFKLRASCFSIPSVTAIICRLRLKSVLAGRIPSSFLTNPSICANWAPTSWHDHSKLQDSDSAQCRPNQLFNMSAQTFQFFHSA